MNEFNTISADDWARCIALSRDTPNSTGAVLARVASYFKEHGVLPDYIEVVRWAHECNGKRRSLQSELANVCQ